MMILGIAIFLAIVIGLEFSKRLSRALQDLSGQSDISRFVEIARALSAEQKMEHVLEMILDEAANICKANGGGIGLVSDDETSLSYMLIKNQHTGIYSGSCPLW